MLAEGWVLLEILIHRSIIEGDAYADHETYVLGLPRTLANEPLANELHAIDHDSFIVTFERPDKKDANKVLKTVSPKMSHKKALEFVGVLAKENVKILAIERNEKLFREESIKKFIQESLR